MTDERRRPAIDPAVASLMGDLTERRPRPKKDAKAVKAERRKARDRDKMSERTPNRATYDLPPGLKDDVVEVAEELGTTASQVVAFLLVEGLRRLDAGDIDLSEGMTPSESPRYKWNLRIPRRSP